MKNVFWLFLYEQDDVLGLNLMQGAQIGVLVVFRPVAWSHILNYNLYIWRLSTDSSLSLCPKCGTTLGSADMNWMRKSEVIRMVFCYNKETPQTTVAQCKDQPTITNRSNLNFLLEYSHVLSIMYCGCCHLTMTELSCCNRDHISWNIWVLISGSLWKMPTPGLTW